jgi:hypothetical protein
MNKPRLIQRSLSLLSISMLILFTAWMAVPGFAEETEEVALEIEVEGDGTQSFLCGQTLKVEGDELLSQYQTFLDLQTKSDEDNSERLDQIMVFYRYVVGTLEDRLEELSQEDLDGETVSSAADEYNYCANIKNQYVAIADMMLGTYYTASTSSKVTFQVVDGLKAFNSDLADMSTSFHATFPSMFNKFNNAFPCYINTCISK